MEARHLDALVNVLLDCGYARAGEQGATRWNFLLAHPQGAVVDLHVLVPDEHGNGVLGPPEAGNVHPADSLTGRGRIGDRVVDCIAAQWAVRFRDAYVGDVDDRADVRALCDQFGLAVPKQYR